MDQRTFNREEVARVLTNALLRADGALWERFKECPDDRELVGAAVDALEIVQTQVQVELERLLNGN